MSLFLFNENRGLKIARRPSEDARQYVYRIIKNCILELFLPPGQKMNELNLASSLNVSRTPVHDTFTRLSRENLVDIIPQRGAFVSKIDSVRVEHAVWMHTRLGISMIHTIFIKNVTKNNLENLYYNLGQLEDYLDQGNLSQTPGLLSDYYHQLYQLAGNMELIWNSLEKSDMDLHRLLYLATSSSAVVKGFLCELTSLTNALVDRNNDQACLIYTHHMSRMLLLIEPLKQHNPEYFICDGDAAS